MPLTAHSTSQRAELDVEQTLKRLAAEFGQPYTSVDAIPEAWRAYLRTDLQCPSCFVNGAEIVRSATKTGKASRQSFFRFTTPGHRPHCDFGSPETANTVPENLVLLTESKSNLTRAVRELVCTGIEQGVFSQVSIRDMREWFFNKKVASLFAVTLDSRLFAWISALQENMFRSSGALPGGVELTPEIAALPQFDWRAEAARRVMERYPQHEANMQAIMDRRIAMFGDSGKRAQSLSQRFNGRSVFDPAVLVNEYGKTRSLAEFIGHNYAPLKAAKGGAGTASVLALSALLLFVRGWDVSLAISDFVKIAAAVGGANKNLGNVMGLNPFHDYEAWEILKRMQDLKIAVPDNIDIQAERAAIGAELRQQFSARPMAV
ncbi:hypothetical protein OI25_3833 [Paraburkholderia fungorum]|uniref:Uncharacterized protein n=1 Tax=Paraburkholderia fungorum TaxID=134537 RepID=A0AAU8TAT9_9BURK|nr:hypothetical protein [Paraburkholderia fungorum]AJZ61029.1 hypothetical protein OI25_3833 [Paraburkholderia fungorum]